MEMMGIKKPDSTVTAGYFNFIYDCDVAVAFMDSVLLM